MKKLFLSSIVLLLFSTSMLIFQISCKKETIASPETTNNNQIIATQQNKIVFSKYNFNTNTADYWTANIDGTNQQQIQIALPSDKKISSEVTITPDGKKIIFSVFTSTDYYTSDLYTCNVDGSGLTKIIGNSTNKITYGSYKAY